MTFAFSDIAGIFWVFAFPAFLHILNAYNGRNSGITAPRSPAERIDIPKFQRKPVKSNRGDYKNPEIKLELDELHKSEYVITHAPIKPHKMSAQVKPTIRAAPKHKASIGWQDIPKRHRQHKIDGAPVKIVRGKMGKSLKSWQPYKPKNLTGIERAQLVRLLDKQGIDDKISHIDSTLSYEENKSNLVQQYGAQESDSELMQKYRNYSDMARDEYKNN